MAIPKTFALEVEGVGSFIFRKRTLRDQIRIENETNKILGGIADDLDIRAAAVALATLTVLTEKAPDGWDLEDCDPLDPDATDKVFLTHRRLREQERAFRERGTKPGA